MNLVNVEGYNNLMKDTASGGVVNVDKRSYQNYIQTRKIARDHRAEQLTTVENVDRLQEEINSIKGDLNDIKVILMQLINK